MRKLFSLCVLGAALAAPLAVHATTITGQFSIDGSVTNNPSTTTLTFDNDVVVGPASTLYGSFASILAPGQAVTGNPFLNYGNSFSTYTLQVGPNLTVVLNSINGSTTCSGTGPQSCFTLFTGTATYLANGYTPTKGTFSFSTQDNADVTFSATGFANPVPEPSSLMLLGTGVLGAAGMLRKRFLTNA